MKTEVLLREELCEWGAYITKLGLIGAAEGNLSVRLDESSMLITPAGKAKGSLRPEDMVVVNLDGTVIGPGKPSSEFALHLGAYQGRPDCDAVIHAHPLVATSFALVGWELPIGAMPEAAFVLGEVGMMPFVTPGTDAVRLAMLELAPTHKTVLMSNHGAVTLGKSLQSAAYRMETLERVAQMLWHARVLGKLSFVPEALTDKLVSRDLD